MCEVGLKLRPSCVSEVAAAGLYVCVIWLVARSWLARQLVPVMPNREGCEKGSSHRERERERES